MDARDQLSPMHEALPPHLHRNANVQPGQTIASGRGSENPRRLAVHHSAGEDQTTLQPTSIRLRSLDRLFDV